VDLKVPNLRLWVSAGAYLPANLNTAFEDRFGIRLLDGYGTTETSTYIATNGPSGERVLGSCGLPLPGLAVRLVTSSGKDVPVGQEGELIVRGPNIMRGYHNKPEETARALRDGWYYTGDLAKSDENGFLTLTGRLKELINRGGQKIAPGEIEEVVQKHELVFDCAVVGMPHEHLEEVPVVFVQPRAGATIDVESIQQLCRAHLSAYKVPHFVRLVAEIPRSESGKILRHKLKKSLTT
jgi:long-chain acyl-CoA synthetase